MVDDGLLCECGAKPDEPCRHTGERYCNRPRISRRGVVATTPADPDTESGLRPATGEGVPVEPRSPRSQSAASSSSPADGVRVSAGSDHRTSGAGNPPAAKRQEWAIYLGDKIVTVYEDEDTAADSLVWYIETYGSARLTDVLTIGPVRDA